METRQERFLRALIPEAKGLEESLSASGIEGGVPQLMDDASFLKLVDAKVEPYIRFCYQVALAKIAKQMMEKPEETPAAMLKFFAERSDDRYAKRQQDLRRPVRPEFDKLSRAELLRLIRECDPQGQYTGGARKRNGHRRVG